MDRWRPIGKVGRLLPGQPSFHSAERRPWHQAPVRPIELRHTARQWGDEHRRAGIWHVDDRAPTSSRPRSHCRSSAGAQLISGGRAARNRHPHLAAADRPGAPNWRATEEQFDKGVWCDGCDTDCWARGRDRPMNDRRKRSDHQEPRCGHERLTCLRHDGRFCPLCQAHAIRPATVPLRLAGWRASRAPAFEIGVAEPEFVRLCDRGDSRRDGPASRQPRCDKLRRSSNWTELSPAQPTGHGAAAIRQSRVRGFAGIGNWFDGSIP